MSRCCSQCGNNGHNSRTCAIDSTVAGGGCGSGESGTGAGEIILFGVRVTVDSMRKSVSMNNLSQYEQPQESSNADVAAAAAGYASADDVVHHSSGSRERKRGVPWTEEEHKLFLLGLHKVGKGDWRGISRNFVKTRTPTQVASHAQKYFLRRSNLNRRRRRSSLFDITTDTVTAATPMEEEPVNHQDSTSQRPLPPPETCNSGGFPVLSPFPMSIGPVVLPVPIETPMENLTLGQLDQPNNPSTKLVRPIPVLPVPYPPPPPPSTTDLNLNLKSTMDPSPLSLKLSLSSDHNQSSRHSAFQVMSSFNNGDSIISVA
ncbi:hypothetical protein L1049_027547 [Liquidambar formosana]|uniref:Uncharacterized protein n=1 Tax=Liquidambar formosana TaxID=63359 RepID=A0AAP0WVK7_LIQFO